MCVCVREREVESVCCLQAQGHREVEGSVRMSGGICVCVCEGNHLSCCINALALPLSLQLQPVLPPPPLGSVSDRGERLSGEASSDSFPSGGILPEQQHQSKKLFLPMLRLSPFLHRQSAEFVPKQILFNTG